MDSRINVLDCRFLYQGLIAASHDNGGRNGQRGFRGGNNGFWQRWFDLKTKRSCSGVTRVTG